jgi:nicotinate-nucleotide adenylyltransferase
MKIGIFGGTFNPPHLGHLIVAESVCEQLRCDTILFIPSANPPNKSETSVAAAADRLHMTRSAVEGNSRFAVSDIEAQRGGLSYTIDTVMALADIYTKASLSLIIGADNLLEFQTWKSPDEILSHVTLVAMTRPGYAVPQDHGKFSKIATFVNVPQINISGTEIRRKIKMGRSIRYLVPNVVEEYIRQRGLYKE